jgi:hypothetical protein
MHHVRVPAFTTASALDLISPQSVAHICRKTTLNLPVKKSARRAALNFLFPGFLISFPLSPFRNPQSEIRFPRWALNVGRLFLCRLHFQREHG